MELNHNNVLFFLITLIMGGSSTLAFKIIFDWLKVRKNGNGTVQPKNGGVMNSMQLISLNDKLTQTIVQVSNLHEAITHLHTSCREVQRDLKSQTLCPLKPRNIE